MSVFAAPSDAQQRLRLQWQRGAFALDVDLSLPGHGITVLYGPSGCGKTSLLRCVAGLERASGAALVQMGAHTWQDNARQLFVPTHQRAIGYVFQEASLFEHLSVRDNIAFGRPRRPVSGATALSLEAVVELLGIGHLLARRSTELSGGERQRVAIARALVNRPRLVMADEPTGNLDARNADAIFELLGELNVRQGTAFLVVTHDLMLAKRMTRQMEMRDGQLSEQLTMAGAV